MSYIMSALKGPPAPEPGKSQPNAGKPHRTVHTNPLYFHKHANFLKFVRFRLQVYILPGKGCKENGGTHVSMGN